MVDWFASVLGCRQPFSLGPSRVDEELGKPVTFSKEKIARPPRKSVGPLDMPRPKPRQVSLITSAVQGLAVGPIGTRCNATMCYAT
jgi:hypothetical protein